MLSTLRWLFLLLLILLGIAAAGAISLAIVAVEDQPLVRDSVAVDHATVASSKDLVKRILRQLEYASGTTRITVTEGELRNLAQLGSYTFSSLQADIEMEAKQINSRLSVQLPDNPLGRFINLSAEVGQSSKGLAVNQLQVGPVQLPGRWLLPLIARLADRLLQSQHVSQLLASIQGLGIEGDTAVLVLHSPRGMRGRLKQAFRNFQASRMPAQERAAVLHYYSLLSQIRGDNWYARRPFGDFMVPLMSEAQQRSAVGSAVVENRAALWALAIYFSYGQFENLVGDLVSSQRSLDIPAYYVTLGGRRDLMQHFLYSAAITLATQQGIGIAAGEFKELLDSGSGGSGFSFADLAADRAGVQFATLATASEADARALQRHFDEDPSEGGFFPDIGGLSEGLTDNAFKQRYRDIRSPAYLEQVAIIDQRIARLPAFSRNPES